MTDTPQKHWLLENRVQLLTVPKNFTTEAFQTYDEETCLLMETLPHPLFHLVADLRMMEAFPPLSVCIKMRSIRHAHMGWLIIIGASKNSLLRFFINAVVGATRVRYKDCDTLDEALSFLAEHDPALPPLAEWAQTTLPTP